MAESRDRRIRYYVSLSFFPHEDPEDFRVSYDACWEETVYDAPGRRSKKREEEILSTFRERADAIASEHGAVILWDRPLGAARRARARLSSGLGASALAAEPALVPGAAALAGPFPFGQRDILLGRRLFGAVGRTHAVEVRAGPSAYHGVPGGVADLDVVVGHDEPDDEDAVLVSHVRVLPVHIERVARIGSDVREDDLDGLPLPVLRPLRLEAPSVDELMDRRSRIVRHALTSLKNPKTSNPSPTGTASDQTCSPFSSVSTKTFPSSVFQLPTRPIT